MSYPFKICDPVHGFIRFGEIEKQVIDSRPFQRLRYIHQLAVAYLVYPGATHTRFEHSLGVMELVTRMYNTLIATHNQVVPLNKSQEELNYWRLILRIAALCHDMGHLPFSHIAEKSLLPNGGHESMTLKIIHSPELQSLWRNIGPEAAAQDVEKLCLTAPGCTLNPWEKVLSKIITEDSFGADRIDYLIRDGHYTGVGYGHFDYHQLIDCLRFLPDKMDLSLGITASGIQSVESLWIARYMMYARVYQHPKVRVFSSHMHRFMQEYFQNCSVHDIDGYLEHNDCTVLAALAKAAKRGNYDAQSLLKEKSAFSEISLAEISPLFSDSLGSYWSDSEMYSQLMNLIKNLQNFFGKNIFIDEIPQKEIRNSFPVIQENGTMKSCFNISSFLRAIPSAGKPIGFYVHPEKKEEVTRWLIDHCEFVK